MNSIEDFLKYQPPRVQKNVEIVTPESLGQDFFLHIDIKTALNYYPKVSERAMSKEDRTVPRVTVAITLENCFQGYSAAYNDFVYIFTEQYRINKVNFEQALFPNTKLVPDTDDTKEYWLVTYNRQTVKYKPIEIGTVFIRTITTTAKVTDKKRYNSKSGIAYLELFSDDAVRLNDSITVGRGYYELEILLPYGLIDKATPISKKDYMKAKNSTISTEADKPKYASW